jgi:cation transport ATPase
VESVRPEVTPQNGPAPRAAGSSDIDEVHGEVNPAEKLLLVDPLQKAGHVAAMAADGINDAPALAKADMGRHGNRHGRGDEQRSGHDHEG